MSPASCLQQSECSAYGAFPDHMAANEAELVIIVSPTFRKIKHLFNPDSGTPQQLS